MKKVKLGVICNAWHLSLIIRNVLFYGKNINGLKKSDNSNQSEFFSDHIHVLLKWHPCVPLPNPNSGSSNMWKF